MSKNLNIIILGCSASFESKGQTPDDINESIIFANNNDINLKILLVDPAYNDIELLTEGLNNNILNERELIALQENFTIYKNFYNDFLKEGKIPHNEDTIYVSYIGIEKNIYDLINIVESYPTEEENVFFYLPKNLNRCKIMDLINDYLSEDKLLLEKSYDIYQGNNWDNYKNHHSYIKNIYLVMCEFILHAFKGKFQDEKRPFPKEGVPHWCYNTNVPIIKGLIKYYELTPREMSIINSIGNEEIIKNDLHRPSIEFTESSIYRKQIMEYMCRILANFMVNNNLINITEINKWMSSKTYELIFKRLNEL